MNKLKKAFLNYKGKESELEKINTILQNKNKTMKTIYTQSINWYKYISVWKDINAKSRKKAKREQLIQNFKTRLTQVLIIVGLTSLIALVVHLNYNYNVIDTVNANELSTDNLCQNLYMRWDKELLEENNCDINAISDIVDWVKKGKDIINEKQGYYSEIQWGRYKQPVRVYDTQVNEMIKRWYSLTRVIDLVTILTMECNRYDWKCRNTSDIWFFQINRIAHKQAYLESDRLFYNSAELFKYQLTYANDKIVQDLEDRFCGWQYAKTNQVRFMCIAKNYNGNVKIASNWLEMRENYMLLARYKRELIARYIVDNYPLLTND